MQWRIQGGGGGRIGRGPPLFSADFCFFGRFLLFSGAASRNLDSRPPLFTDPGSASDVRNINVATCHACIIIIMQFTYSHNFVYPMFVFIFHNLAMERVKSACLSLGADDKEE